MSGVGIGNLPLSNLGGSTSIRSEEVSDADPLTEVGYRTIAGEYLESMRIGLLAGRALTPGDSAEAPPVALLSQTAARRFFGEADPLGRRIQLGNDQSPRTIVGIVRDVRDEGLDSVHWWRFAMGSRSRTGCC